MAHWIVRDYGFGGEYFKCSDCGEMWWSILERVSMEDRCPNCGAEINEDENEYIDEMLTLSKSTASTSLGAYCELETKLIQLTGFNLEKLVELFLAGYTLRTPEYKSIAEFEKECE